MPRKIPLDDPRRDIGTVRQACSRFGVSKNHFERLIREGHIAVFTFGMTNTRHLRFSEIDRYFESTRVNK